MVGIDGNGMSFWIFFKGIVEDVVFLIENGFVL